MKTKNEIIQRNIHIAFAVLFLGTALHGGFAKYQQTLHDSFWANQSIKEFDDRGRLPSSLMDFNPDSIEIYRDYFNFDSFQKYLSYDLELVVQTNQKEAESQLRAKELFQRSLKDSLSSSDIDIMNLVEGNLISDVVQRVMESLDDKVIYQVDLNFSPRVTSEFSFKKELASNDLLVWYQGNTLLQDLKKTKRPLHEVVADTSTPQTINTYQYKGGQISLWFSKAHKKGFIRFRRYCSSTELAQTDPFVDQESFRLSLIHFKKLETKDGEASHRDSFITIDIYKDFHIEKTKPRLNRMEVHFGKLLPPVFHEFNLIERPYAYQDQVIETSELNLHGVVKHHGKSHIFVTKLEKLVFNFQKGEFSDQSKLKTTIKSNYIEGSQKGVLQHKIHRKLIHENAIKLIDSFDLGEIHKTFKGGRI